MLNDVRATGIGVENWFVLCQDRERWSSMCAIAVDEVYSTV